LKQLLDPTSDLLDDQLSRRQIAYKRPEVPFPSRSNDVQEASREEVRRRFESDPADGALGRQDATHLVPVEGEGRIHENAPEIVEVATARTSPASLPSPRFSLKKGTQLLRYDFLQAVCTDNPGPFLVVPVKNRSHVRRKQDRLVDCDFELHETQWSPLPRVLHSENEALLILGVRVAMNHALEEDVEWSSGGEALLASRRYHNCS
jgi:hypothetical protein